MSFDSSGGPVGPADFEGIEAGPSIAYLGPSHKLNECYVRVFCSELETKRVDRLETIAEYLAIPAAERGRIRLTLVDESLIEELLALPLRVLEELRVAPVAIAFRDPLKVRRQLAALRTVGIHSLVPLGVPLDVLLSILRLVTAGGTYMPAELALAIEDEPRATQPPPCGLPGDVLTRREVEVLQLVARGRQNKHIAEDLVLSQHTVKLHIHNIINKLGVSNRTEAAARYFAHQSR